MHPQDKLIIIEALAQFGGKPSTSSPREERAWELLEEISADLSVSPSEGLRQIDEEWSGPHA